MEKYLSRCLLKNKRYYNEPLLLGLKIFFVGVLWIMHNEKIFNPLIITFFLFLYQIFNKKGDAKWK